MSHPLQQFFKPVIPAFRHFCQLCEVVVEDGDFISERARSVEARMVGGGDFIFCKACHPFAERVVIRLKAEENRMDDEHVARKKDRLDGLGKQLCEEMKRATSGASTVNRTRITPKPAKKTPKQAAEGGAVSGNGK